MKRISDIESRLIGNDMKKRNLIQFREQSQCFFCSVCFFMKHSMKRYRQKPVHL